jgi:septal ring factor EnvC (AmiA/AmiB activator)
MNRTHDVTISAFDLDRLERELAAVTEQRDRAQSKIENQAERIKYLEGATNHATGTPLSKMREQRDMLAEALDRIAVLHESKEMTGTVDQRIADAYDMRCMARDALAAVKGGGDE